MKSLITLDIKSRADMVKLVTVLEKHTCNTCKGSGRSAKKRTCMACKGTGKVEVEVLR